jgi:hypothetical protein
VTTKIFFGVDSFDFLSGWPAATFSGNTLTRSGTACHACLGSTWASHAARSRRRLRTFGSADTSCRASALHAGILLLSRHHF